MVRPGGPVYANVCSAVKHFYPKRPTSGPTRAGYEACADTQTTFHGRGGGLWYVKSHSSLAAIGMSSAYGEGVNLEFAGGAQYLRTSLLRSTPRAYTRYFASDLMKFQSTPRAWQ